MDGSLTLHGYFRSSAAWRVRIALEMKGIPYAPVFRHLRKGEQSAPDHLALNPQGLVPTLEVAGAGPLTQSLAILEWLEETAPSPALLPSDPWGRARARALAGIVAIDTHPIQNLRVLQYLKREMGQEQPAIDAFARHWIALGLANLTNLLDPDAIVLAGGVSADPDIFLPRILAAMSRRLWGTALGSL